MNVANTTENTINPNQNTQTNQKQSVNQGTGGIPQNVAPGYDPNFHLNSVMGGGQPQYQQNFTQPNYQAGNYQPGYQQIPNNQLNQNQNNLNQNLRPQETEELKSIPFDPNILEKIKNQEPEIYGYIQKDRADKKAMQNRLFYQQQIIDGLHQQLRKFNDIAVLAQEGFKPGEHELLNRICGGNITAEQLREFKQRKELSFLRDEMALAEEEKKQTEEETPLFAKHIGWKGDK